MTGVDQSGAVTWRDGVPVSTVYGDPYYTTFDGLAESRHVFLDGNALPERFRDGFHVAETGFGTGLNLLAAWSAFRRAGVRGMLRFTSFEAHLLPPHAMARAHAAFPDLSDLSRALLGAFDGRRAVFGDLHLTVVAGDARQTLPSWSGRADAWFLDGFAPAKNPELWEDALLRQIARHSTAGGSVSTYTAAGAVRRGLDAAGFDVRRVPGYGRKRHMTVGRLRCR